MSTHAPAPGTSAARFRRKVLLAMTLVIAGVTGAALFFAQRAAEAADQARLQREFQGELGWLVGSEEARREAISARCRTLARSVRILAALEEGEMEDLYRNASVELRDVLGTSGSAQDDRAAGLLRAREFRFLDAAGKVIPPGRDSVVDDDWWQSQLSLHGLPAAQENGYVAHPDKSGREAVSEIIITPIVSTQTGEASGALVLFFPPVEARARGSSDLQHGILLGDRIFSAAENPELTAAMREAAQSADKGSVITAAGAPYMAFSFPLNPDSDFPAAHMVCLYPISESLAKQRTQQVLIASTGVLVLAAGMLVSLLLSSRLARPVHRLARDTEENIALRRQAEAAREFTERKYQSIFENAIEGLFVMDSEGRFLRLNPALAAICGFAALADGLALHDGTPLYAQPGKFRDMLDEARDSGPVSRRELEMIRTDGARIWVSHNVRCVRGGPAFHFEGSMEDVTERRRAAEELRTLNAGLEKALTELKTTQQQVIQQERLRALGEMASGVAHDFNNALTPILGYSEILLQQAGSLTPREVAEHLRTIQIAATDAASVVSRLREFYRTSAAGEEFHRVDLNALARQIVSLTQPRWKDQARSRGITISLVTDLDEPPAGIEGDASALREMLTNMVFNAVDAMPDGGTVTLRTRRRDGRSVIEVEDTGTGMTEEVRRRCLEPFFSTKGDRGTGLGLSMCFGIVQRHRGTLDIRSALGKGTTFIISFPASERAAEHRPVNGSAAIPATQRPLSVLVVDDEQPIRMLLGAMLKHEGHKVALAEDGPEALELFGSDSFDLVITDKSMPRMNGDQLAAAVKQSKPGTPVILLTGFGQFLDPSEVPGVDFIANKPISAESLRAAIATASA